MKSEEINEPVVQNMAETNAAEAEEGDDSKYPFPMATVVRNMKQNMPDKMISSKVKIAMNLFLGEMVKKISEEMGKSRYSMIEMDDFQRATNKFTKAEDLDAEKDRIVGNLIAIRSNVESMVRELERKFSIETL